MLNAPGLEYVLGSIWSIGAMTPFFQTSIVFDRAIQVTLSILAASEQNLHPTSL